MLTNATIDVDDEYFDGYLSENQILINYDGVNFQLYGHQNAITPAYFSTIDALLKHLKEDLEEFKDWYDYEMYYQK